MKIICNEQQMTPAEECMLKLPMHKKYQCLYLDPPWQYSNKTHKGCTNQHYETMTIDDLKKMRVNDLADKDCMLFMWATGPMLEESFGIIKAWNFKFKTLYKVWTKRCKNGNVAIKPGWYSRPSVELLLVATKGKNALKYKTTCAERQEFASIPGKHSEKPEEIRQSVKNFLNVPNRLELFARTTCDGFDSWGLDIPGYFKTSSVSL